jgi:rubrerythrin
MAKLQNITDILEVAVRIERNGVEFYKKLYDATKSSEAKEVFSFLAAEEEKHVGIFREMLDEIESYSPRLKYPGEYELYLDGIAARAVAVYQEAMDALSAGDFYQAINIGIDLEMESIVFYAELKERLGTEPTKMLDAVIQEEKSHLSKLEGIRYTMKV